jgi:Protein of unknown function (DUF3048) N-terminal domain/Protein of unknown function (DUF3048) C-terminal domain/Bacterial Ig-like domain
MKKSIRFKRGWMALAAAVVIGLTGTGGYLAYANTLPTSVALNVSDGQKEVATDTHLVFTFNRSVSASALAGALSIAPVIDGALVSVAGSQTRYEWVPKQGFADLTAYTVTIKSFEDTSKHQVKSARWSFTTTIVPRIVSVTLPDGTAVTNGLEVQPGSRLAFNFNDTMVPDSVRLLMSGKPVTLTWAKDFRSASMATSGLPSGPLVLALDAGARDSTGHSVKTAWSIDTGLYYHDNEHTVVLKYPALIQVPNDYFARDQAGLQAAGVVFEYLAEGGITRLTAIYDRAPDMVGPMRSSRLVSLKIARHYRGLLFQSGESAVTQSAAGQNPVPQFFDTIGYTFRSASRYAPDNLMITGDAINRAEQKYYPNVPAFAIPKARPDLTGGTPATSASVPEHYSVYRYDPYIGTYAKSEEGHLYKDAHTGGLLRIEMLVVLHTHESLLPISDGHGSYIHDFDLDTGGRADIYYKGMLYSASWSSSDSHGPLTFSMNGQAVTLPPGLVWIDVTA